VKVSEIMTAHVLTARADTPVGEVALTMTDRAISGMPVLDGEGRVIGLVTERELVLRSTRIDPPAFLPVLDARIPLETPAHYRRRIQHIVGTRVSDVMTEEFTTIGPDSDVEELAALMAKPGVNPVPVVEEGRLVGIVSRADLVRMMTRPAEAGGASSP
jgi:CBS domain-containing protein